MSMRYQEIFPDVHSACIFVLYMALFINQGLIVTASQQNDKSYNYNTVIVVFLTEVTKLIVTFSLYLKSHASQSLSQILKENKNLCVLYLVPAFLYCLYNNLAFLNLSYFDPTTYFVLLQFRVLITGLLFQFIFKRKLSIIQWISLLILTVGCIVKNLTIPFRKASLLTYHLDFMGAIRTFMSSGIFLIILQVSCSSMASVYNEKLLKKYGAKVDVLTQNLFMCVNSLAFNFIALMIGEDLGATFTLKTFHEIWRLNVLVIILNNALVGIVTAFFLKHLNSIVKNYASALELIFTAVLSWIIFGIEIHFWTVISILLVTFATLLYAHNPVVNTVQPDGKLVEVVTIKNG